MNLNRIYRRAAFSGFVGVLGVTASGNAGALVPHSAQTAVTGESATLLILGLGLFLAARFLRRPATAQRPS